MSMPDFILPDPPLSRDEVIGAILASIAFEELGLAHILNAEGEKIQKAISIIGVTPTELDEINQSVSNTLRNVIKKEILLQFKLEDALQIPEV